MDLEHDLNQSWTMFSSGVPVYKEGGRLVVDDIPKLQLPIPNRMSPDAAALGDAPTPTALDGAGRAFAGGLADTGQGAINLIAEGIDLAGEKITGAPLGALDAVRDLVPKIETIGIAEDIGRVVVNVVTAAALMRTIGIRGVVKNGAAVSALMDPEEGNLATLAKELGLESELLDFMDSKVEETASAGERLQARMTNVLVDMGLGGIVSTMFRGFSEIKKSPEAAAQVTAGLLAGGMLLSGSDEANAGPLDRLARQLAKADSGTLRQVFKGRGAAANREIAITEVNRIRAEYPPSEGWAPLELVGGEIKDGKFEPKWKQPAYNFHIPQDGLSKDQWKAALSDRIVASVQSVVDRAAAGDEGAKFILSQATWYRDMRSRLRQEFGGMADLFADLLGTTSAQTNVRTNWDNASEIMRRFSRGEYDKEIANYERAIAAGEDPNKIFSQLRKGFEKGGMSEADAMSAAMEQYPMLTKAAGTLFGTNSPTSAGALLDTFRQIKTGASPKTPNFTGNLIGYTDEATVDVWAARYLTDLAGLQRIPPAAEKAVGGKHLSGSTLETPKVGGEFGFGQTVFKDASEKINSGNIIPDETLGPDDLQAVAWFIEKEKWTNKGWTNKAGEGGSLDFEAARAGSADPARIAELRKIINAKNTLPADKALAQAEFDQLAAPVDRTIVGIAGDRPGQTLSNYGMAELAAPIDDVLRADKNVLMYKVTSTIGRFMKQDERALDTELVTRQGFNPAPLERRIVELGKEYDQDAVFISKVLRGPAAADHANARPGVEIYFTKKQSADALRQVTDLLSAKGVDGFTFVTDARQADRVNVQARAGGPDTAGLTGIRFQYIPEFDETFDAAKRGGTMQEKADLFRDIVEELSQKGDISSAQVLWYDTKVTFRDQYDVKLGASAPANGSRNEVRQGQLLGPNAAPADRSGGAGPVSQGTVPDRQRSPP